MRRVLLLKKLTVPVRVLRYYESIKLAQYRTNYELFSLLRVIYKNFNKSYDELFVAGSKEVEENFTGTNLMERPPDNNT